MKNEPFVHVDVGYPAPEELPETEQSEKEKVGERKSDAYTDTFRRFIGSAPTLADQ